MKINFIDLEALPPKGLCEFILEISYKVSLSKKEIPVVAVVCSVSFSGLTGLVFKNNFYWKVESISTNLVRKYNTPLYHAEFVALEKLKKKSQNLYFSDKVLITNLEPCFFCFSLCVLYRIKAIFYFLRRNKGLSANDLLKLSYRRKELSKKKILNHHPKIIQLKEYSKAQKGIIKFFFQTLRNDSK